MNDTTPGFEKRVRERFLALAPAGVSGFPCFGGPGFGVRFSRLNLAGTQE
jgi:hypothetical protein